MYILQTKHSSSADLIEHKFKSNTQVYDLLLPNAFTFSTIKVIQSANSEIVNEMFCADSIYRMLLNGNNVFRESSQDITALALKPTGPGFESTITHW